METQAQIVSKFVARIATMMQEDNVVVASITVLYDDGAITVVAHGHWGHEDGEDRHYRLSYEAQD